MESGGKNQRARSEQQRLHEGFEWDAILCIRRRSVSRQVEVALRLRKTAACIGANTSRTDESQDRTFSIAHVHSSRWGVRYLSCGLSQPLKVGLRFSTNALRDSSRSLFAP